jgi:hypothetical protein
MFALNNIGLIDVAVNAIFRGVCRNIYPATAVLRIRWKVLHRLFRGFNSRRVVLNGGQVIEG